MNRSLSLLNEMGDLTITWEEDKDQEMEQIIQKKLDEGVRFFIIKPLTKQQVQIKTVDDVTSRTISVPDEDVEKLFTTGKVGLVKRVVQSVIDTISSSTSAKEIATNHSVGVKQFRGG